MIGNQPLPTDVILYGVLGEAYLSGEKLFHEGYVRKVIALGQRGVNVSNFRFSGNYSEDLDLLVGLLGPSQVKDTSPVILNREGFLTCISVIGDFVADPQYRESAKILLKETIMRQRS
jgi:hypothetical protein